MTRLSKVLPYTCYEVGHTWNPSCSYSCFEIGIAAFMESCRIYGVVYLVQTIIAKKSLTIPYIHKILLDYLQSVIFLSVNGFAYIGSFCFIRRLVPYNFLTASFLPGFVSSVLAILVERPTRRPMLATYVTNVASECLWNMLVARGYVRNIPHGEVLLFCAAVAVWGFFYRSSHELNPMITSIMQLLVGKPESGKAVQHRLQISTKTGIDLQHHTIENIVWFPFFNTKNALCPHNGSCLWYAIKSGLVGFGKGWLLHLCLQLLPAIPKLIRSPSILFKLITLRSNVNAGFGIAWINAVFRSVCCLGRHISGKETSVHGGLAGALSGLAMMFYSPPSLALYAVWKTIESLYAKGYECGHLPNIPGGVVLMYSLSTGFLFHTAVMEKQNMKPSYWKFLERLTAFRYAEFNRHLLEPYGMNSGLMYKHFWPTYDTEHLTPSFMAEFAHKLTTLDGKL